MLVPTRRRGNAVLTRLRRDSQRDAGASRIGSHAGAWEPEKNQLFMKSSPLDRWDTPFIIG
ncbi:MAG: hypothetical protein DRQ49_17680 [Gammaproteobacteria bacterium]|nr:MAG: hypothetical protein DRQ49_17680 [Gammaproteobacteria bacterium]